jgi:hypothetical protein
VGKSYLILDIALSLATGREWRGHRLVGRDGGPGKVHYVMAEGLDVNKCRRDAWLRYHGVDGNELRGHFIVSDGEGLLLTVPGIAQYRVFVQKDKPDLIILDTKNALFTGEESSGRDHGEMIRALNTLRKDAGGATVVLIGHSGLGDPSRSRGSNAEEAGVGTATRISRDEETGLFTAYQKRDKSAGAVPAQWHWRLFGIDEVDRPPFMDPPAVCVPAEVGDFQPIEMDPGKWWTPELPEVLAVLVRAASGMGRRAMPDVLKLLRALEGYDYLQSKIIRMVMRDGVATRKPARWSEATVQNAVNGLIDAEVIERTDAAGVGTRIRLVTRYSKAEMPN